MSMPATNTTVVAVWADRVGIEREKDKEKAKWGVLRVLSTPGDARPCGAFGY